MLYHPTSSQCLWTAKIHYVYFALNLQFLYNVIDKIFGQHWHHMQLLIFQELESGCDFYSRISLKTVLIFIFPHSCHHISLKLNSSLTIYIIYTTTTYMLFLLICCIFVDCVLCIYFFLSNHSTFTSVIFSIQILIFDIG